MKKKKRKTSLLQKLTALALCMALMLTCLPVYAASIQSEPVPTASTGSSKAYKKAYKKLLLKSEITVSAKNGPYKDLYSTLKVKPASFLLLDIDRNGTPELIISGSAPTASSSTRYVYTMKKEKAVFCGYYSQKMDTDVQYSKKNKALLNWYFNRGAGLRSLLRISNYKLAVYHEIWSGPVSLGSSRMAYEYAKGNAARKAVTKAKYDSIEKKYFSDKKVAYEFAANTAANRNKLLK